MEMTCLEDEVENRDTGAKDLQIIELLDLHLAVVGGGIGETAV